MPLDSKGFGYTPAAHNETGEDVFEAYVTINNKPVLVRIPAKYVVQLFRDVPEAKIAAQL